MGYACKSGNLSIIKYLVDHGADVSKMNYDGETPLFNARLSGNEAIVKYLVDHGADINKKDYQSGEIPLFNACLSGNEAFS